MAIQVDYPSRMLNTVIPNAYIKLDNMSISNGMVSYNLNVYLNEQSRQRQGSILDFLTGSVRLETLEAEEGENLIQKMYNFAKRQNKTLHRMKDVLQDV